MTGQNSAGEGPLGMTTGPASLRECPGAPSKAPGVPATIMPKWYEGGGMATNGWERPYEEFAADLIGRHQIPGVAVALAHGGTTIYEASFGHRDAARSRPVTPDTRFGLGSVTKS